MKAAIEQLEQTSPAAHKETVGTSTGPCHDASLNVLPALNQRTESTSTPGAYGRVSSTNAESSHHLAWTRSSRLSAGRAVELADNQTQTRQNPQY